jgi:hypothetical protein
MEQQPEQEKKKLSSGSREAINKRYQWRTTLCQLLCGIITNLKTDDALTLMKMCDTDDRRKNRYVPRCHVLPSIPRVLYFNHEHTALDQEHSFAFRIGLQRPETTTVDSAVFACHRFSVVCNLGTLIEHLTQKTYANQHRNHLLNLYEKMPQIEWYSRWLIVPEQTFSTCDLAYLPDIELFAQLPEYVKRHISKHGLMVE